MDSMAGKKTKKDYIPHVPPEEAPVCDATGCREAGVYKAPKSKDGGGYRWYCLDHIREYNRKWDFFSGMDRDEIEAFMRDAVTGHRPTWGRETLRRHSPQALHDALYEFLHGEAPKIRRTPPLPARIRKALAVLDMEYPYTQRALKARYRALARKHHPDVNKGTRKAEELFKNIAAAYKTLSEHLTQQK